MSVAQDSAAARSTEFCTQHDFAFRFDWGAEGLLELASHVDAVVIVDVLRFTTAVSAAIEAGGAVIACALESTTDAVGPQHDGPASLSPTDLLGLRPGTTTVLPSPNGGALTVLARASGVRHVLAGSIRNAAATAAAARDLVGQTGTIAVIAAGERRRDAGPTRPAVEDLLGAGAILAALDPAAAVSGRRCSPEAAAARAAFVAARPLLHDALATSASGRELIARGDGDDVAVAAALDVTEWAAVLDGDTYVARSPARRR